MTLRQTNAPAGTEALTTGALSRGTVAEQPAGFTKMPTGLQAEITWHPHWSKVPPVFQRRIMRLAANAPDALGGILIREGDSNPVLSRRYGWTRGETLKTLEALRKYGIAYSGARYEPTRFGGQHQIGSEYRMVRDGVYAPQKKRTVSQARRRGAKRAARTRNGERA